ncbi:phospholipase A2 inhibitor and Ly6/PLAUR domain-containing protein-like [Mantella aurantiaca]
MKSTIFSSFLLLFLPSIVLSSNSKCYSCLGQHSETCEHKNVECRGESSCVTISEEFGGRGLVYRSIKKRCAMNLPCDTYIYAYSDNELYLKINLKCCEGDMCNSYNYEMPNNQTKEDGILCPSCHKYDTLDGCNATKSMVCLGEDDMCIKFRATVLRPDGILYNVSAQGCSNAKGCLYDFSEAAVTKMVNLVENTCYRPTVSPPNQQ